MTARVERVTGGIRIEVLLSEQALSAMSLDLAENDVLEIEAVNGGLQLSPSAKLPRHIEAYRRTRSEHEAVYAELAK